MIKKIITVDFTPNEALVLFEWIASLEQRTPESLLDNAEQKVLWTLEGKLESSLVEVFSSNYAELVLLAKRHVIEGES